ncbi:MAG TPA: flagellar assembly protein FliW [Verrucomicrobiae bacterium]|jgi:flagellar assembly factor FliW|nr:flagellar assembly protein FliW [Verrucomicrobiae bacterium]
MKWDNSTETEAAPASAGNQIRLPAGILGFEHIKEYVLLANPAEMPFAWLRPAESAPLAFVVINPFYAMPDYAPDVPDADVEFLGLKEPADALLFSIVTLQGSNRASLNLKGPIVVNRHTHIGKQVIIANASNYSVEHPLPVAAATV